MIVINNATSAGASSDILIGSIVLWYGSASAVPSGFSICNGISGSTPDLRGRFVRGAANSAELLTTGGSAVHLHAGGGSDAVDNHSHSYSSMTSGAASNSGGFYSGVSAYSSGGHTHSISGNLGGGGAHSHVSSATSSLASSLPPHMKIYWIKKVS